ncbi:hypothetical protein M316_0017 [Nitrincola phage 1M3-16]|uniref:hypothetical protein n=1 Tax=Nitrincola phage 1M3-16 TaxID=1472912 RepID=UPI000444D92E|nr:hypothetical protein GJ22_gp135 [Nitrincola phage 1M3-16]AHX01082.1 hypothetical protein M316_0017 [Nitrincola phage 1M3-16]
MKILKFVLFLLALTSITMGIFQAQSGFALVYFAFYLTYCLILVTIYIIEWIIYEVLSEVKKETELQRGIKKSIESLRGLGEDK